MAILTPVLFLSSLLGIASGWRSEGILPTDMMSASYVGKFCFDYLPKDGKEQSVIGIFDIELSGHVEKGNASGDDTGELYLAVYSDEKDHWKRVRPFWDELTCQERRDLATTLWPVHLDCNDDKPCNVKRTWRVHQGVRPRFWYYTFINCGATIIEPVTFGIHAKNILQGFEEEFSLDQTGSLVLEGVFAVLFLGTFGAIFAVARSRNVRLESSESGAKPSPLLRLLGASAMCSALGCACRAAHHLVFAHDGRGFLLAAVLGTFWACMAKAALTLLQILVAKGWAILSTPDEQPQRVAIVLAITGVISISVGCEVWEQFFHDQSTSFYLHESWPGHIILMLNIVLLVTTWNFLWKSYTKEVEPHVRSFYAFTAVACGIYFASLPVMCLLAELLDPWVRRKYVERVEVSTRFVATAMLALGLRPSNMHRLVSARLKNRDAPELLNTEEMMDTA